VEHIRASIHKTQVIATDPFLKSFVPKLDEFWQPFAAGRVSSELVQLLNANAFVIDVRLFL